MATVKTDLCNMAISLCGSGKQVANFDTDQTEEARACRQFFVDAMKEFQTDWLWNWNSRFVALSLLTTYEIDASHPTSEWNYSYRKPDNCLFIRRFVTGNRVETEASATPFRTASDGSGEIILTDHYDETNGTKIEYSHFEEEVARMSAGSTIAFAYLLASRIVPRIAGKEGLKLVGTLRQEYMAYAAKEAANSYNEVRRDLPADTESIEARN